VKFIEATIFLLVQFSVALVLELRAKYVCSRCQMLHAAYTAMLSIHSLSVGVVHLIF